jgi:hypothetical protein
VDGNPTCQGLGYDYGFKPEASDGSQNTPGTYDDGIVTVTWSFSAAPSTVNWESNLPVAAVIVKGGSGANLYDYEPPRLSDTNLVTPNNPSGGPAGLSHLEFCYDYAPTASKTAETSYDRAYTWDIDKDADATELTLSTGQSFLVNYTVKVTRDAGTDSGFTVSGTVTVENPWPVSLDLVEVTDSLVADPLTCSADTVAAGGTVTCDYSASVANKDASTNVATVKTQYNGGPVRTVTAQAPYSFGDPTTETDECVDVSDSLQGALGTVCNPPVTFSYTRTVGPYDTAGTYEIPNTACFVTNDTEAEGCDDHNVTVTVPGLGGCTLTQGYWKTHSAFGPAPYDDAWTTVGPLQQNTLFFTSGKTWYELFWTAPKGGDTYLQLAHQYMAAKLNQLNGASAPNDLISEAEAIFSRATGTKLKSSDTSRAKVIAGLLDGYNNGVTGPGHCSE